MRIEALLWSGVAVYFAIVAAVYAAVGGEPAGVAVLAIAAGFGGLVAGWSWRWSRQHSRRPADRDTADVADELGEVGIYPGASLRPLGIAAGFTLSLLGLPLGSWMSIAGLALLASQVGLVVRDRDG
jgi:hypothetical protein